MNCFCTNSTSTWSWQDGNAIISKIRAIVAQDSGPQWGAFDDARCLLHRKRSNFKRHRMIRAETFPNDDFGTSLTMWKFIEFAEWHGWLDHRHAFEYMVTQCIVIPAVVFNFSWVSRDHLSYLSVFILSIPIEFRLLHQIIICISGGFEREMVSSRTKYCTVASLSIH